MIKYLFARLMHFYYHLTKKVELGKELTEELYYISFRDEDPYKGRPLKVIRHVFVTTDPQMGKRPCYEVQLPLGREKLYLDPEVGSIDFGNIYTKAELEKAGLK